MSRASIQRPDCVSVREWCGNGTVWRLPRADGVAALTEPIFHPALALAELPLRRMRCVTVAGREVLICHLKEGVFAVDNICTHALARMDEGRLRGTRLICSLHGASFDVRDGRVLGTPASRPLPSYPVRIVEGMIEVALEAG